MAIEEGAAAPAMRQAMEQGRAAAAKAGQTVKEGYEAVQQYAEDKGSISTYRDSCNANHGWLSPRHSWSVTPLHGS